MFQLGVAQVQRRGALSEELCPIHDSGSEDSNLLANFAELSPKKAII